MRLARPRDAGEFANPLGKNPGDVIKIGSHHGSSLTKGRATHYDGQLIESDIKGKNPSDTITTKFEKEWEEGKEQIYGDDDKSARRSRVRAFLD